VTRRQGLIALLAVASAGFVALTLDVTRRGALERHDSRIGLWVLVHTPHTIERLASAITMLGGAWSLVAFTTIGAVLLLRAGRPSDAGFLVGGVVLVSLATNGLKIAVGRPRPATDLSPVSHTASFPSGHTSGAFVVFVLLALFLATRHRHAAIAGAVLLAGLVGVTRVVVRAHWTTDVLAGYCLGAAVVAVVLLVRDRALAGPGVGGSAGPDSDEHGEHSREEEGDLGGPAVAEDRSGEPSGMHDVAEPRRDVHVGR
jgi:undecaprenyl-diphosphatase